MLCNIFLSFSLTWKVRDSKTNSGRVAIDGPSQGSANGPLDLHRIRHSVRLPEMYKIFRLLFNC